MSDHEERAETYAKQWFCQNNEILWKRGGHYKEEVEALAAVLREAERRVWEEAARLAHEYALPEVPCITVEDTITERTGLAIEALIRAQAEKAGGV